MATATAAFSGLVAAVTVACGTRRDVKVNRVEGLLMNFDVGPE